MERKETGVKIMKKIHGVAGFVAVNSILLFFASTVAVELFGTYGAVASVKRGILYGLFILVPAMAAVGGTGFRLSRERSVHLLGTKKMRMRIIGGNGIFILVPSAVILDHLASSGGFGRVFYSVQILELIAGALNISLITLNIRDGLRLAGRFGKANPGRGST